jgi:glycosyltransferase involved in cell wall biosynthesis
MSVSRRQASTPRVRTHRRRAIFTIVSCNYIAYAATLMQSVREFHPDAARYIVLADAYRSFADLDLAAELLACNELGIEFIGNMQLWYTVIEFNTAIKPFVFRRFLETENFDEVVYLDPDILLFRSLTEVFDGLSTHDVVLTPHMMKPLQDGKEPSDLTIMKSGVYNLGFLGVRNGSDGRKLMEWWSDRCFLHCRVDIAGNMFTDQRWMDLAPVFVSNPLILRHPGYNVAYWNLVERQIRRTDDGVWLANDQPLTFFHFSGIVPEDPRVFSKHQNRFTVETLGPAGEICTNYRNVVLANGWREYSRLRYAFGTFPNGRRVEDAMRHWVRRAVDDGRWDPRDAIGIDSRFFDQADEEAAARDTALTRFMYQFWLNRRDLQDAFDIFSPQGYNGYVKWFINGDGRKQGVDGRSIAAARRITGRTESEQSRSTERLSPPWPVVSGQAWQGPASEAETFLRGDVTVLLDGERMLVPLHVALLWEQRQDLQKHFSLQDANNLHKFVAWALTTGVEEGAVDPALLSLAFLDHLAERSTVSDYYGDVPVTVGLIITRFVESPNKSFGVRRRFPVERIGRLAQGLWFSYVAAQQFNWPQQIVAPVLEYFDRASHVAIDGFSLSNAVLSIWELRDDIRTLYPLDDDGSIRGYLHWLLVHGLGEMAITLEQLGDRFRIFLLSASPRLAGLRQLDEILYFSRSDLQDAFDVETENGRQGIANWLRVHFLPAPENSGIAALFQPTAPESGELEPEILTAEVALTGQWSASGGRGEDVRCSALSLQAVGFSDFLVVDIDTKQVLRPDGSLVATNTLVKVDVNILHMNAQTAYDDWRRLRLMKISARISVGSWAWELERLPSFWRCAFTFYDEIWASTRFAERAFSREQLRPVRLMPMAVVAPLATREISRRELCLPENATVYLFMFDFRSYSHRKNPEAVVRAFLEAFPDKHEKVYLVIKTMGGDERPDHLERLDQLCADARISLRDTKLSRDEIIALIRTCDAFVSLHRSEGFGRGPAEAMLLGQPTILTGYSGTSDFATDDCAYVVDYVLVPVATSEYPGVEDQRWADASVSQAAGHMRRIHERPDEARGIGGRARAQIMRLFDPEIVGAKMLSALAELTIRPQRVTQASVTQVSASADAEGRNAARVDAGPAVKRRRVSGRTKMLIAAR